MGGMLLSNNLMAQVNDDVAAVGTCCTAFHSLMCCKALTLLAAACLVRHCATRSRLSPRRCGEFDALDAAGDDDGAGGDDGCNGWKSLSLKFCFSLLKELRAK